MNKSKKQRLEAIVVKLNKVVTELTALEDEIQESRDGWDGTGLAETDRAQRWQEAVETIGENREALEEAVNTLKAVEL